MHSTFPSIMVLLIAVGFCWPAWSQATDDTLSPERLTQAIVWLEDSSGVETLLQPVRDQEAGYTLNRRLSARMNIWLVDLGETEGQQSKALNNLRNLPDVRYAGYNHPVTFRKTPDDPLYGNQWERNNSGQSGGTYDAGIDAPEAWDITTGGVTLNGDTVVIAVLDDGFDIHHEDLVNNMWKNRDEIPGNNIDDDENGYVDDYHGWDFYYENDSIYSGPHGTRVGGIVGAEGNNGKGIAGINWNVKLLPVAVETNEASVVEAYSYILEFRARYNKTQGEEGGFIVATNSSFGIDYKHPDSMPLWCAIYDTLGSHGILSVAATMNSSENVDEVHDMPTSCPSDYLITVTSTNKHDELAPQAGYGSSTIDLGAPGVEIMTTSPNDNYGNFSGTSFAAPMVAGAIGLIYTSSCQQLIEDAYSYPDSMALSIKSFIMHGVDTVVSLQNKTVSGGRLNLVKSLLYAENYSTCHLSYVDDPAAIADQFGIIKITPNPASDLIAVSYSNLKTGNNRFVLTDVTGRTIKTWDDGIKGIGTHQRQFDVSGFPAGIYFMRITTGVRQSPMHKFMVR